MEIREQLYEGKAKRVYATDDPKMVVVAYKDDATALDGLKRGTIAGKGVVNNRMSNLLFSWPIPRWSFPTKTTICTIL